MVDVKSFVIDRAKWGKGKLLNADGSMCCLGFLGQACGVTPEEMRECGYPAHVSDSNKFPEWARDECADDIQRLVSLNDSSVPNSSGARRCRADVEKYITKTFEKHGIVVKFKGKAKKAVKS